jgi:hypothetical protein
VSIVPYVVLCDDNSDFCTSSTMAARIQLHRRRTNGIMPILVCGMVLLAIVLGDSRDANAAVVTVTASLGAKDARHGWKQ